MNYLLKVILILLAAFIQFAPFKNCGESVFAQTSGGPDAFGYTWRNSFDTAGPVFFWKDISLSGTPVTGLADDNLVGPFSTGINFHYYWSDYNQIWVGSNGYFTFQSGVNISSTFPTIPMADAINNNFIAPFMADMYPLSSTGANVYLWSNNIDTFIIQYDKVPFWSQFAPNYSGSNSFQVILSAADSSFTFQYYAQAGSTYNNDIKTGMENVTGDLGLQVLNNTYPTSGTAVKFYYPKVITYQVYDLKPQWNQNPENGGFFISRGGASVALSANIVNTGTQDITTPFSILGQVRDSVMNIIYSDTATVDSLYAGADTTVFFTTPFNPANTGAYFYRSRTLLGTDMIPTNDLLTAEMNIVDTTAASIELKYDNGSQTGIVQWIGGGGAGTYFEPPFYPALFTAVEYYMVANSTTDGFIVTVRDDNGTGVLPGTLLYTDTFPGGIFSPNMFTAIGLPAAITVDSGGLYIGWEMDGDSIAIGTNNALPISNRSYEILGGGWAYYRNRANEDMMIRAIIQKPAITAAREPGFAGRLEIFPNPAKGFVRLTYELQGSADVKIFIANPAGQTLAAYDLTGRQNGKNALLLNMKSFPAGVYFCTLRSAKGTETRKIILH